MLRCVLIIPIFIESLSAADGVVQTERNEIAAVSGHIRRIKCPHSSQFHVFRAFFLWETKRSDIEEEGKRRRKKINRQNTMSNRKFIQMKRCANKYSSQAATRNGCTQ